ncbi:MAG: alpha/beta fold hydrolase [Ruminococcus sp.]|nr:alpha/beta fold hydrolase [Ruminococcus sp.]
MIVFLGIVVLVLLFLVSIYVLYHEVFCHPLRKRREVHEIPDSDIYRMHKEKMLACIADMERTPHEEVSIVSADGLRLCGHLYQMREGAPLVIFFHGYHGVYAWDGYGFFKICKKNGYNILLIDERAHGKSEGNVITFGIKERHDCKLWVEYALERFGAHSGIFLAGVSMGAATVMMASELELPENVKAIIADCGYSEPAEIIRETMRKMGLPDRLLYPFIRLGARLFGHFDLEEASPLQAVRKLNIPILFIQGDLDDVVPVAMGEELYAACVSEKERLLVAGAGHANSAVTGFEDYEGAVMRLLEKN